jgi:hypothetical protein
VFLLLLLRAAKEHRHTWAMAHIDWMLRCDLRGESAQDADDFEKEVMVFA